MYRFGELTIACTHEGRVIFPETGITKGELVAYYADVAEVMVPELRGRPLTRERYQDGVAVYQKHWQRHYPAWIDSVVLPGKTPVRYPIADSAAALVYFANQGAVALHVTTSRKEDLTHPDRLVFDLDPPEGAFPLVRRAAGLVRSWLDGLGLPVLIKTTGGKGLHLVIPLDGTADGAVVWAFCERAAAILCGRHPDVFTTEFHKADRHGRVYLDLGRNQLGATFVAAYSVRAAPGGRVSAPIGWDELDDAPVVRLRDVRARLDARGDPWAGLRDQAVDLGAALRRCETVSP